MRLSQQRLIGGGMAAAQWAVMAAAQWAVAAHQAAAMDAAAGLGGMRFLFGLMHGCAQTWTFHFCLFGIFIQPWK